MNGPRLKLFMKICLAPIHLLALMGAIVGVCYIRAAKLAIRINNRLEMYEKGKRPCQK